MSVRPVSKKNFAKVTAAVFLTKPKSFHRLFQVRAMRCLPRRRDSRLPSRNLASCSYSFWASTERIKPRIHQPRLGRIEIQSRSSLDRGNFLALYLCRRANFWESCAQKTLFAYTKDTLCVLEEPRYSIGVGIADTDFLYREQP